ncbi:hypothetical protein RZS08_32705, partial [Arthrospira platensis SPKY1]|nr:hypothetical protein [Arthrospira platensis SPKY1]
MSRALCRQPGGDARHLGGMVDLGPPAQAECPVERKLAVPRDQVEGLGGDGWALPRPQALEHRLAQACAQVGQYARNRARRTGAQ